MSRVNYMKLSQDATNEIWSVILRGDYEKPAARKRAIEREIRATLEAALGLPSTVDGNESGFNIYGEPCPKVKPNPYTTGAAR